MRNGTMNRGITMETTAALKNELSALSTKLFSYAGSKMKFKKDFKEYNSRTCIVVVNIRDTLIGLIVDSVVEVVYIADENIVVPPNVNVISNKYVKSIGKVGDKVKLLLDCEKIFTDEELFVSMDI